MLIPSSPATDTLPFRHLHAVKRLHGLLLQFSVATCLLCGCLSSSAFAQGSAQASNADSAWHFRYDLFQMLIEERGLTVLPDINRAVASPEKSVIVIAGTAPSQFTASDWAKLINFVRGGGNLLIATDSRVNIQRFGQFFTGPVTVANAKEQYQGFPDCLLVPIRPEAEDSYPNISPLVTNRSGWFEPDPIGWMNWQIVAALPEDCRPAAARLQALLAIGRVSESQGIALVSADASIFSNGMLWHGNAPAAILVSDLLCAGDRQNVVFIADELVLDSYRNRPEFNRSEAEANAERELPRPELDKALSLANAIAREVAQSNAINEALARQPRGVPSQGYFRAFLLVLATILLLWILVVLIRRRVQPFFVSPRPMQPGYEIRNSISNPLGNFRNAAGYLAREFCFELTGSTRSTDWQQYLVDRLDRIGPVGDSLAKVIDLACRGCHTRMTRFEFQQLGQTIQLLRTKLCQPSQAEHAPEAARSI